MITTSDTITLDGGRAQYRAADIYVEGKPDTVNGNIICTVSARDPSTLQEFGGVVMVFDYATVNGYTTSKTGTCLQFIDKCDQAVKDVLQTLNVSASFTIP